MPVDHDTVALTSDHGLGRAEGDGTGLRRLKASGHHRRGAGI